MTASTSPPDDDRIAGSADDAGVIYWPGDDEVRRAPGTALVLLIVSFVGGGLYLWQFGRLISGFDWIAALTLKSSALIVVGGLVMILGAILTIRHGLIWASRLGALIALAPPIRLMIDGLVDTGGNSLGSGLLELLFEGGPSLLVLLISFSPALTSWRLKRQETVKAAIKRR